MNFKSPNTEDLTEFIVEHLCNNILLIESPSNKIFKFQFDFPDEYDSYKYWSWIAAQIDLLIDFFIQNKSNYSINFIYIGDGDNSPHTLHQYFKQLLKLSDFDISDTDNEVYEWLSFIIELCEFLPNFSYYK